MFIYMPWCTEMVLSILGWKAYGTWVWVDRKRTTSHLLTHDSLVIFLLTYSRDTWIPFSSLHVLWTYCMFGSCLCPFRILVFLYIEGYTSFKSKSHNIRTQTWIWHEICEMGIENVSSMVQMHVKWKTIPALKWIWYFISYGWTWDASGNGTLTFLRFMVY